jgi:hypothetical protein
MPIDWTSFLTGAAGAGNSLLFGAPETIARKIAGDESVNQFINKNPKAYGYGKVLGDVASAALPLGAIGKVGKEVKSLAFADKALEAGKGAEVLRAAKLLEPAEDIAKGVQKGERTKQVEKMINEFKNELKTESKSKIYYDALKTPEPRGMVTKTGDKFYFSKTSNAPEKSWSIDTPPEEILKELKREGWEGKIETDMKGFPQIKVEHISTKRALEALEEAHDKKWEKGKDVFVRYGDLPEGGKSKDFASGNYEKGVSVFRGKILPDGSLLPMPKTNQELGSLLTMNKRPMYVVTGDVVGVGADGEPVLANAKKIKPIEAAKKIFGIGGI